MKKYVQAYFGINTRPYRVNGGCGFDCDADREAFYRGAHAALAKLGFQPEKGDPTLNAYAVHEGEGLKLHVHPDSISGLVPADKLEHFEQVIYGDLEQFGKTRTPSHVLVGSSDQIIDALNAKRDETKRHLVELAKTKNKNTYKPLSALILNAIDAAHGESVKYRTTLGNVDSCSMQSVTVDIFRDESLKQWAQCLAQSLVEQGILVVMHSDNHVTAQLSNVAASPIELVYARSLGKTEAKADKRTWIAWRDYFETKTNRGVRQGLLGA